MKEQSLVANIICVLQKSRKEKHLDFAKQIYPNICNNGLETHGTVENYIVPMFVECRGIIDAHEVFIRLFQRNEHSWTSLISGYLECGQPCHALRIYKKLQEDYIRPSPYTFIALLRACVRLKDLKGGRQLHLDIKKQGFERDLFLSNNLIHMYGKCGTLVEAKEIFDGMSIRDATSWNALMAGYVENEQGREALECFDGMQKAGMSSTNVTFLCGIKACSSIENLEAGREIHADILKWKLVPNPFIGNALVDMYAKCHSLLEACKVFDQLQVQDVVAWNALIAGYAANGLGLEALKCFKYMQLKGISANAVTFACSLKACESIGAIDKGREIHIHAFEQGYERDIFVSNTLIDLYVKYGSLAEARNVFDKMPVRDVVSWTSLVSGYAENGFGMEALICFNQMELNRVSPNAITFACCLKACGSMADLDRGRAMHKQVINMGIERDPFVGNTLVDMYAKCGSLVEAKEVFDLLPSRDVVSWSAIISGYTENGLAVEALGFFDQMQAEGVLPNIVTFVCALKACSNIKAIDKGREIHRMVACKDLERDIFIGSTLVDMYASCGLLADAQEAFHKMPIRDEVSWTTMVAAYAERELAEEVLKCYEQMRLEGVPLNALVLVSSLKACGSIGAIDKGREIHSMVSENGFEKDLFIATSVVDMYAKCGSLAEAQAVFDKVTIKDVALWNAMIRGYGINHEVEMAMQCFDDMHISDIEPDAVTFVCILTACSRAGLVSKGLQYMKLMNIYYGYASTMDHYSCMVDLLARSGYLHEACQLLDNAPCSPSIEAWTILLSACKTYGETSLGLRCFQKLMEVNPEHAVSYTLMSDILLS